MGHPVNWFEIEGPDGKALSSFYKKVFSWKVSSGAGGMTMVTAEPGGIAGGIVPSRDGSAAVRVYVSVADIDAHLAKVEKAGGKRVMDKMELPEGWGWIGMFLDPAGNQVGLWQPGAMTAPQPEPVAEKKPAAKKKAAAKKPAAKKAAPAKVVAKAKPAKAKAAAKAKPAKKAKRGKR